MADALLVADGRQRFSWGSGDLARMSDFRAQYTTALKAADSGRIEPLLRFVRR